MVVADVSTKSLAELLSLSGRRAVVTGGARGLGKAIGRRLAEAGAAVLLTDVDKAGVEAAAKDVSASCKGRVLGVFADVTDSASVVAAADTAVSQLGGLDIWINNAGIYPTKPLLEMRDEEWDKVLDINLRGTFIGAREAARRMVAAGRGGVIVNLSSMAGVRAMTAGIAHYGASKTGIRGLTRQMALELAPHNIRVLAVAPTLIATEGVLGAGESARSVGVDIAKNLTSLLGRGGVPDDVARVVLFCASDLAIFMTGSTLLVDAGEAA